MRLPSHQVTRRQHSHAFHELVLILDGQGKHAVGNQTYPIGRGDVFVLLGDMTHGYPAAEALSVVNLIFDPVSLGIPGADLGELAGYHRLFTVEPRVRRATAYPNRLRLSPDQLARAAQGVARIEEELNARRSGYRFLAIAHLMALIGYLSRCASRIDRKERLPLSQISKLLGHMERHAADPLTLADLCRIAHVSPAGLNRAFRHILGRSPIDHLIRLRIARAERLLRDEAISITEIAFRVGFNDSNYFARAFRRFTGLSPRAYRGQARGRSPNPTTHRPVPPVTSHGTDLP